MSKKEIILRKVRVHNLKEVDLDLPAQKFIVFTGVSGSGKSSLAFDTIYMEGQRRYVESLSAYARRHLGDMPKPDADTISGISPTIAIEQKTAGKNPRSTVGTLTGIYDYLRVLYARVGTPYCPISQTPVKPQSTKQILHNIYTMKDRKLMILCNYVKGKKGELKDEISDLERKGFTRLRIDGKFQETTDEMVFDKNVSHDIDIVIDRVIATEENHSRIAESVTSGLEIGKGMIMVWDIEKEEEILFSQHAFSPISGKSYPPLEPHDFSFNHPSGMCPTCHGLGFTREFDLERIIDKEKSIAEDCCSIGSSYTTVRYGNIYDNLAKIYGFNVHTPWKNLSDKAKKVFLYGTENKWTKMRFVHPTNKSRWTEFVWWKGILFEANQRLQNASSELYQNKMKELMMEAVCPSCEGKRIKPYPAATKLSGRTITEITALPIQESHDFFQNLTLTKQERFIANELIKEIMERLSFLKDVGLDYLTIDRTSPTLSGGEAQRVRLASQIGSGLVGATYVLDEPSIGLHPRDNTKLIQTLKMLRDKGNTVIVVEHDEETIAAADYVVDVGPGAGIKGGNIVAKGKLEDIISSDNSITGAYLSGKKEISIPSKRRKITDQKLVIWNPTHHNLKGMDVEIPLGVIVAITGVSGSGKSSLIGDILYPGLSNILHHTHLKVGKHDKITGTEFLDKVIEVDQSPIGRTPRSNPSTYIKLFDEIRDLFCSMPEALAQGYKAGRFSFNVKEGSCPHCSGMGMLRIDMDFLEDIWVTCEFCNGKRFDSSTLSVTFKGKNIHDVLEMTVSEALDFFKALPKIRNKLELLSRVGLDYISLGQASPTLSGGEAQRIKLAKELSRPSTGKTLYILDEPTTGLHFADIDKLCKILHSLVDQGNSVIVIEHNMDLVKTADWILDLGPDGGSAGGRIVAFGAPEKIIKQKTPTARPLQIALERKHITSSLKEEKKMVSIDHISVKGASEHNLKEIDAEIPREKITICTGPSGSGKTSFAFDTVYAEGQRRYVESMSLYARQFVDQMPKPKVEQVEGLSPAIAIEQKQHAGNPRSTVGTMTEIYDFLRILYAYLGTAYCPETKEPLTSITKEYVVNKLLSYPEGTKMQILSPLALPKQEAFSALIEKLEKDGYLRIRVNGTYYELGDKIPFDPKRKNSIALVIDRLSVSSKNRSRFLDAVEKAATLSSNTLLVDKEGEDLFYNLAFAAPSTGKSYPPITHHTFSFNTPQGMCPDCLGIGVQYGLSPALREEMLHLTPIGIIKRLWDDMLSDLSLHLFEEFLEKENIPPRKRLRDLPPEKVQLFLYGSKKEFLGPKKEFSFQWIGIHLALGKLAKSTTGLTRHILLSMMEETKCPSCEGTRLNPLARNVKIENLTLPDFCHLPIEHAVQFLDGLKTPPFLKETLVQLQSRLSFLEEVGLSYLSLDRSAPSLSGGEAQRIHLSKQIGSSLTGCLYVLDEPTIGLHPQNIALLHEALRKLTKLGNTLLLVEHDPMTIAIADYILDFGPAAGRHGGKITARGTYSKILSNPDSLTGAYLSGKKQIALPKNRKKSNTYISITKASIHNLKNIDVKIPIQTFTCISGVSGSGKSSLMNDLLRPAAEKAISSKDKKVEIYGSKFDGLEHFDKLIVMDQNPIGLTSRADVSTYTDLLSPLRYLFASFPKATMRGLEPKHFSYNHRKGMCLTCFGLGYKNIEMKYLPAVTIPCEACQGYRLNPVSLEVTYKEKHLGQILDLTVEEAKEFLIAIPKLQRILDTLISVGLGYLKLNQEIATLSGGEAQRIRLSRELSKRSSGKTLYLFDEPTIGLHTDDIAKLLPIFHRLVEKGNTLVMIEHNLDIIASADYILDLGKEAGPSGGNLVAVGTPEEVAQQKGSYSGQYLATYLAEKKTFVK